MVVVKRRLVVVKLRLVMLKPTAVVLRPGLVAVKLACVFWVVRFIVAVKQALDDQAWFRSKSSSCSCNAFTHSSVKEIQHFYRMVSAAYKDMKMRWTGEDCIMRRPRSGLMQIQENMGIC